MPIQYRIGNYIFPLERLREIKVDFEYKKYTIKWKDERGKDMLVSSFDPCDFKIIVEVIK